MLSQPHARDRAAAGAYRVEDADSALFAALTERVRRAPDRVADTAALARECGVSQSKLAALLREHAHLTPAAWLKRERVRAAYRLLLESRAKVAAIGEAAGFESESVFHRQFIAIARMTPGAYRALDGATVFMLQLPAAFRARELLDYHGRDPASPCERVEGNRVCKALLLEEGGVVLEIALERSAAWCRVHAERKLGRDSLRALHTTALRMLGLTTDVAAFEAQMSRHGRSAALIAPRRGLRLPLAATGFDALCWAIIGQQINLAFASALRRELLELAGPAIGGMRAHPSPAAVARIDPADLTRRRYSRSKAEYLLTAARAAAAGDLDPERLGEGSAVTAERQLTELRGIGTWTARYMLMRGAGFADCAPVGDVALAAALQKHTGAAARPAHAEVETLMRPFAPHRSLATFHLWASLKDPA